MLSEIITIGDEILIGQTIDTNSAWLGSHLTNYGIEVIQISSINDKQSSIVEALREAEARADVILITGGLGPTKDDITKKVLAEYFNANLVPDHQSLENIKSIFSKKGLEILQTNIDQALVPSNCTVIPNTKGTAPGMYFEEKGKIYVSMPGVPYEMKAMMDDFVFDRLLAAGDQYQIVYKTLSIVGVPESIIADKIDEIESNLPEDIKLAYLPHLTIVRLRLSGKSKVRSTNEMESDMNSIFMEIKEILGEVYYDGDLKISEHIGHLLKVNQQKIGTIESCSGGYLAHQLTLVTGSSSYFKGSLLTYAYETKVAIADIDQDTLNRVGAVSYEVCEAMARNAKGKLEVDFCIATTGIAGPGGGTPDKPVGLVYIGLAKPDESVEVKECFFRGTREQVIERTSITAFNMVRQALQSRSIQSS